MGHLLLPQACRASGSQSALLGLQPAQHDGEAPGVLCGAANRADTSAGGRHIPAHVSARSSSRVAAGESDGILFALRVGGPFKAHALCDDVLAISAYPA